MLSAADRAGRSQLHDTLCTITDEFDRSIGKPSADELHEVFRPVWNGLMSMSSSCIHLFGGEQDAKKRKCPRSLRPGRYYEKHQTEPRASHG
jgi:hypothetical protein